MNILSGTKILAFKIVQVVLLAMITFLITVDSIVKNCCLSVT